MDFELAVGELTEELYIVTASVDGHVAGHGEGFEDSTLVATDGERVGTLHLTEDRDFVIDDEGVDGIVGRDIGGNLLLHEGIGLLDGETSEMEGAHHGEVDVAIVVDEVLVELPFTRLLQADSTQAGGVDAQLARLGEVELSDGLRLTAVDEDIELVLGLDGHVVEQGPLTAIELSGVLEVGDVLHGLTADEKERE